MRQARRNARSGKGLLPPNPKQWGNEHNGLDLREQLGVSLDIALPHLPAFELMDGVAVVAHGELVFAQSYIDHFRSSSHAWSGAGIPLPGGGALVVYNDSHPMTRVRATLMEEFFHLRLGHPPTVVRVYGQDGAFRSYDGSVEGEAYGSGAAALVPYQALKRLLESGEPVHRIARRFEVSDQLVVFRTKVTKLYGRLRRR